MFLRKTVAAALTLSSAFVPPSVYAGRVQKAGLTVPGNQVGNKQEVVNMFSTTFNTYKKFAFGHDDLSPVSLGFNDQLGGWGASIVDALGTMAVMGLDDLFDETLSFVANISFAQPPVDQAIDVFETTIRFVGGFLSAFELTGQQHQILVEKAEEVANKLAFAFEGSVGVPFGTLNFTTNTPFTGTSNIAEAGTLTLEWFTLSKHTGNDTFRQLAEGSVRHMIGLPDPLPGLLAQGIDPSTGLSVGDYITWGGGSDSYFEYLLKYPRLTNTDDPIFLNEWQTAVDSSIKFLARTSTVGDFQYLGDHTDGEVLHIGSHLECFHGGNWLLGGKLLDNSTIVDFALKLVDACWNTYASTATGIGPETFAYISSDGNVTGGSPPSASDLAFFAKHGFYVTGADYILRPEVLESNFYAWRVTGDTKYLDRAASAIKSFNKFLAINNAFSGINDVTSSDPGSSRIDDTESFFFAEVMKYLYLTFDDPNHISLDNFVFNTECHPFIAPTEKPTYATTATPSKSSAPFVTRPGPLPQVSPNSGLVKGILNAAVDLLDDIL